MKVSCLQMNMKLGCPEENFAHAEQLICNAMKDNADVLVLPETWNTGFFPKESLAELSCKDGDEVKSHIGTLAKQYGVNIVAGSVSNVRDGKVFNTAMVFDRDGECIAEYDKTHLFTPMGEDDYYTCGDHLCRFELDGVKCGIIICYGVRFPELTRSLALSPEGRAAGRRSGRPRATARVAPAKGPEVRRICGRVWDPPLRNGPQSGGFA